MKGYIFDLDGTLLDSMDVWDKVDIEFLGKRGFEVPPDYIQTVNSMTFPELAAYTIKRFNLSDSVEGLIRELTDMAAYAYRHTVPMKHNAKEFLVSLQKRGAKMAVATSLSAQLLEPALRRHGIYDMFEAICTTDEAGRGKSYPDVFLLAAQKLGVPPCDCIVFEDILAAVKSAKSAGMTVYGVYEKLSGTDWEQIKQIADHVIYDFKQLDTF